MDVSLIPKVISKGCFQFGLKLYFPFSYLPLLAKYYSVLILRTIMFMLVILQSIISSTYVYTYLYKYITCTCRVFMHVSERLCESSFDPRYQHLK